MPFDAEPKTYAERLAALDAAFAAAGPPRQFQDPRPISTPAEKAQMRADLRLVSTSIRAMQVLTAMDCGKAGPAQVAHVYQTGGPNPRYRGHLALAWSNGSPEVKRAMGAGQ